MKFDPQKLYKIELHVHLDCSLSYDVVAQLRPGIGYQQYKDEFIAPEKCRDLSEFLTRAPAGFQLMQSRAALRAVVFDLFFQFERDNVIYAEIRYAPLLHCEGGLHPEEVVEIVNEAAAEACSKTGVQYGIIISTVRRHSTEQSLETAELAIKYRSEGVVGMDIAGDEAGYSLAAHIPAFKLAQEHGLPRTAHAGEALGPESIIETLDNLDPSRLGHGVRCVENEELMAHLRDHEILLEICPSCNVQINVFSTLAQHPVDKIYRYGIPLSINTDARTITHVTLSSEYDRLAQTFGWTPIDFHLMNTQALQAAFVTDAMRQSLLTKLNSSYAHLDSGPVSI